MKYATITGVKGGRPTDLNEFAAFVNKANARWWCDPETGLPIIRNKKQMLQLMLSEVSEAMEAERRFRVGRQVMDEKLPHRPAAEVEMADVAIRLGDWSAGFGRVLKDMTAGWGAERSAWRIPWSTHARSIEAGVAPDRGEMLFDVSNAIAYINSGPSQGGGESLLLYDIERYCDICGYDLWAAVDEKLDYNATRPDHQDKNRVADGGKLW